MIGRVVEFITAKPREGYDDRKRNEYLANEPSHNELVLQGVILAFTWHKGQLFFAIEIHHPEMPGSIVTMQAECCDFVMTAQQHAESWDAFVRARIATAAAERGETT